MQEYRAPKSIHKAGDALRYLLLHRNVESRELGRYCVVKDITRCIERELGGTD